MDTEESKNKNRNFLWILGLTLVIMGLLAIKYFLSQKNYLADKKFSDPNISNNIEVKKPDQQTADTTPVKLPEDDSYQINSAENNKISKEIYANLLKQQSQIEALQAKYDTLKGELDKIKTQDKLSKIIINFVELKDCINLRQNCDAKLQKLDLLTKSDANLSSKIAELKTILQNNPKSGEQIKSQFTALIPSLIASDPAGSPSYFDKIKYNLAKLIVIRRVDGATGKSSQDIDVVILETEKLIGKNKYQEALNLLSAQNEAYKPILSDFIADLQNVSQLNNTVDDIFTYLKAI